MTTTGYVEDYDALRKLVHHTFDIVLVHKRDVTKSLKASSIPLIPGGLFVWDDNSHEMDNDSTIIAPHDIIGPNKGRWKRSYYSEYEGPISVKWFGAEGNFDPKTGNGADDTQALQTAFKVVKHTGHSLYVPPGKYKITSPLEFNSSNLDADGNNDPSVPWFRMQQGLHIFGAGMQRSIIYNETGGGPAIRIVRDPGDTRTMQQTGVIRDLKITCSKADKQTSADTHLPSPVYGNPGTIGIEMTAAWGYTIQRVRIRGMESHGLILRNVFFDGTTSDYDACAYIHLDHLVCEDNGGWGDHGIHYGAQCVYFLHSFGALHN